MPKSIPIKVLKDFCDANGLKVAIVLCWDGELSHCLTHGDTSEQSDFAADYGNKLKKSLGWPEDTYLNVESIKVKKLRERIAELEGIIGNASL